MYNIYYTSGAVYLYHLTFAGQISCYLSLTTKWTAGVQISIVTFFSLQYLDRI
jgi:hypothetical protein